MPVYGFGITFGVLTEASMERNESFFPHAIQRTDILTKKYDSYEVVF